MQTYVVRIQSRFITANTVNEEGLEVLYSYRGISTRKFQSVVHTCGERRRLSGQQVVLLMIEDAACIQYDTKTVYKSLSWPTKRC
jgi:hypothetical protein